MKNLVRALNYFRPDVLRLTIVALLLFLSTLANLLKPWPLAIVIDSVLGSKPLPGWLEDWTGTWRKETLLLLLGSTTLLLHMGQGAISALQNYLAIRVGLNGLKQVRDELFASMERLSMRFFSGTRTGDLIYRATWDTYSFQTLFQQGLITSATAFLSLLLMVIVMTRLNVPLTVASVATIPLLVISIKYFGRKMRERGTVAQQADSQVTSAIQQTIEALPLIQSYARESDEERTFVARTAEAREKRLSQHVWELLYWLAIALAFSIGTAMVVWLGGVQVLHHHLTVGELVVFISYLAQLYEPLNQLSHVGVTVSNASAGIQRVFEILDTPAEITDGPLALSVPSHRVHGRSKNQEDRAVQGGIRFEHVCFGYEKHQPVLKDVTFELSPGQSLAIIGPSGGGKSTLLNLLPRFYDPDAGQVLLDDINIRELRVNDLRAHIAVVTQEPLILPMTIAENIAYGKPEATLEEIQEAARAANADGFIEKLPRGYHTQVGEGSTRISVGEKQRLNLARAFLKDAPVLLLDEPTSALDAESEALVVASIEKLMAKRTTLIVAHRLSTIKKVDKVLVLKDGKVSEVGTQNALLAQNGYYARAVNKS